MVRVKQSRQELEAHLKEQLGFLLSSCRRYDEGQLAEAKRIATTLRVLFHDTKASKSLLNQLHLRDRDWRDTAPEYDPANIAMFIGLVSLHIDAQPGPPPHYIPKDRERWAAGTSEFNRWWSRPVIVSNRAGPRMQMSRQKLILDVADTDGGAHVDPSVDEIYDTLSRKGLYGWEVVVGDTRLPVTGVALPSLRQIANEVTATLKEVELVRLLCPEIAITE
jgi:hypothetical protein